VVATTATGHTVVTTRCRNATVLAGRAVDGIDVFMPEEAYVFLSDETAPTVAVSWTHAGVWGSARAARESDTCRWVAWTTHTTHHLFQQVIPALDGSRGTLRASRYLALAISILMASLSCMTVTDDLYIGDDESGMRNHRLFEYVNNRGPVYRYCHC
jgi:hypothetical protein